MQFSCPEHEETGAVIAHSSSSEALIIEKLMCVTTDHVCPWVCAYWYVILLH